MLIAWLQRNSDAEYRRYVFRFGGKAFEFATMAQFAVGFWFLVSLPRGQRTLFLGDNSLATLLLVTGIAGAVAAIMVVARALRQDELSSGGHRRNRNHGCGGPGNGRDARHSAGRLSESRTSTRSVSWCRRNGPFCRCFWPSFWAAWRCGW